MNLDEERNVLARERTRLAVERNRLASERTFASWIRTGLAIAGGGFAITKLTIFYTTTHQAIAMVSGRALLVIGIAIFVLAAVSYWKSSFELDSKYLMTGSHLVITLLAILLIICASGLLYTTF